MASQAQQSPKQHISNLVGRFHTTKQLDPYMLMEAIQSAWNLHERLLISLIGNNLFVMSFTRHEDRNQILDEQPWQISGHLLLLQELDTHRDPRNIDFSHVPMWFNFKGLYAELYNQDAVRNIAKAVGTVLAVDPKVGVPVSEKGFRARVNVHLLLPLPKGAFVRTWRNGLVWVCIVPERLPSPFCEQCQRSECDTVHHQLPKQVHFRPGCNEYESFRSGRRPLVANHTYNQVQSTSVQVIIKKENEEGDTWMSLVK